MTDISKVSIGWAYISTFTFALNYYAHFQMNPYLTTLVRLKIVHFCRTITFYNCFGIIVKRKRSYCLKWALDKNRVYFIHINRGQPHHTRCAWRIIINQWNRFKYFILSHTVSKRQTDRFSIILLSLCDCIDISCTNGHLESLLVFI